MSGRKPPRWLERALRRLSTDADAASWVIGDLREEYAAVRRTGSRLRADVWYAVTASRVAVRMLWGRRRGTGGVTGLFGGAALWRDLRHGLRGLRRSPAFSVVAIATFGLGVGATTAIFAAVNGILLKPLPYDAPSSLHRIEVNTGGEGWYGSSVPEFMDFETELMSFTAVAAYTVGNVTLGDTLSPHRARAAFATAELLPMLGVEPMLGRFFSADEDLPSNAQYVVLSWELWQRDYAGRQDILGEGVPLFGASYTVLGVMPPAFAFPDADTRAWFPLALNRANPNLRNNHFLNVLGRLRPGSSPAAAAAELDAYTRRARQTYPEIYSERGFRTRVLSLHESVVGDVRMPMLVLLGAASLVLLIASVNVANLLLSRGESRRRELAVRAAMGASRRRLVRQLVTESLMLATAGGVAGVAVAVGVIRILKLVAPPDVPRLDLVTLDAPALLLALALVTAAGLLFGAFPALRATRDVARSSLVRAGRGTASRPARRTRSWLVASQIAFAGVLSLCTAMMIRTLGNLRNVDPGFEAAGVLSFSVSPPFAKYQQPEQRVVFWSELLGRLEALPGVQAVGATSTLPLSDFYNNLSLRIEGRVTTSIGDAPDGRAQYVTPGLADALGLRVVAGRFLSDADGPAAQPAVVVSQTFAETFWPGENPIGKTMRVFAEGYPWMSVVGVVADLKNAGLDQPAAPMWYVPTAQSATTAYNTPLQMYVMLRTAGPPTALAAAVRAAVAATDPAAPVAELEPLERVVASSISGRTFTAGLLESFGLVALILACIGVYGVTSLAVAERRGEIGLRKALGARPGSIVGLIFRENLAVVTIGAAIGLAGGYVATRLMRSLLFGVGNADAAAAAATLLVLGLTATAAAAVPALRAMRTEALISLRDDS